MTLNNAKYCFRYADQVSVGDEVAAQIDDELLPKKVVNVSSSTMPGICHLKYVFISIVISIHCNIFNNNINLTHFY